MVTIASTSPSTGIYREGKFTATRTAETEPFFASEFTVAPLEDLDLLVSIVIGICQ